MDNKQAEIIFNQSAPEHKALDEKIVEEPIRESVIFPIEKLILVTLLFDGFYSLVFYFLNIFFNFPFEWHHSISVGLLATVFVKNLLESYFIGYILLDWVTNIYYVEGSHLIKKRGVLSTHEDIYDFKTIRSISVEQSLLGKIFHYGDIILKTSASGGYQVIVKLSGIANPQKYEHILSKHF